jgi:hypothetical protein
MATIFEKGPYLEAALLCEKILQEAGDVKSLIRIIDRVTRQVPVTDPLSEMQTFDWSMVLFVRFKSGQARGPMTLEIKIINPLGESPAPMKQTILFEGEEDRGVDLCIDLKMKLQKSGLYWFVISLDGKEVTRIPFKVVYMPMIMQQVASGT